MEKVENLIAETSAVKPMFIITEYENDRRKWNNYDKFKRN